MKVSEVITAFLGKRIKTRYWLLALYDVSLVDASKCVDTLSSLAKHFDIQFNSVGFEFGNGKRPSIRKFRGFDCLKDAVDAETEISSITIERIYENNHLTTTHSVTIDLRHSLLTAHAPDIAETSGARTELAISAAMQLRPRYGFCHVVETNIAAIGWPRGVSGTAMAPRESLELSTLGTALSNPDNPLRLKLHDIYGCNFLTDRHLLQEVDGVAMKEWILSTNTGQLQEISPSLYMWALNDKEAKIVRRIFVKQDFLIATSVSERR